MKSKNEKLEELIAAKRVVTEFADRVLKDITDAINHNARIMESSRNLNQASYHNALIANNACKGIYDVITAIAKEFGVEE